MSCSLVDQRETIRLRPDTMARRIYGCDEVVEGFCCNYGLNPAFRARFEAGGLILAGTNPDGEVRLVELPGRSFFLATLFLPQLSSTPTNPHPLMTAYLKAALELKTYPKTVA